jgi:hypothetical protein
MPASADPNPASDPALSALASFIDRFDHGTRQRGLGYFEQRRVAVVDATGNQVRGLVRGSLDYKTQLTWIGSRWISECTCPVGGDCKHVYATGRAWLRKCDRTDRAASHRAAPTAAPTARSGQLASAAPPLWPPHEQPLVDEFTAATSQLPTREQLAWLRHLARVHTSLRSAQYGWFDHSSLSNLAPTAFRPRLYGLGPDPFRDCWTHTPATPLALWPFIALLFEELDVPLPDFSGPFTDLDRARGARDEVRREKELRYWRQRFATLDELATPPADAAQPGALRLRLDPRKNRRSAWGFSPSGPAGPFTPLPADRLQAWLVDSAAAARALDDGSNALLSFLRVNWQRRGRTTFKLDDADDGPLVAQALLHPQASQHIVLADGTPLAESDRPLTWRIDDHPTDPARAIARLAFADGAPAPSPLLHLGGKPTLYLAGHTLYRGTPPPAITGATVDLDGFSTVVPRAALALPEAGRFARRANIALPGAIADRFRAEPLRARLRAELIRRNAHAAAHDEVLAIELHALAPDGASRARWENERWNKDAPGVERPSDSAFVLHDFAPLASAIEYLGRLTILRWNPYVPGGRFAAELGTPGFAEQFAAWLATVPPGILVELSPELAAFGAAPTRAHFALEIEESGIDWFGVRISLRADDTTLTAEELALLHRARGRFVRLAGRGWRRLEVAADSTHESLARLGLDAETLAATPAGEAPRLHALQLADPALGDALPEKLAAQIRARAAEIRALPPPAVPAALRATLRPYQVEGFHFLAHLAAQRFGGILADDMGLGKTLQTLAWLLWLADQKSAHAPENPAAALPAAAPGASTVSGPAPLSPSPPADTRTPPKLRNTEFSPAPAAASPASVVTSKRGRKLRNTEFAASRSEALAPSRPLRALVVCPKSVVFNWESETARFAPTLTTGRLAPRTDQPVPATAHLVVVNYAQLRLNAETLAAESWDAVILDEGQNIKNPASATAAAARALRARHRIVLTGTPVENRLLDLWSLFAFAQPGLLGGQTAFKRLYDDRENPAAAHARLSTRVRHFLLRRTKAQVATDLPPRTEEDIVVELDGPQRKLYEAELKRARQLLLGVKSDREFDAQRFNILQSLLRLRQICCDPRLLGAELTAAPAKLRSTEFRPDPTTAGNPVRTRAADAPPAKVRNTDLGDASAGSDANVAGARKAGASAKLDALLDTLEPLLEEGHRVLVFSQFVTMLDLIHAELVARDIAHLTLTGQTENRQELVEKFQAADGPPVFLLSLKAAGAGLNLTAASYVVLYDPWWNPAVEAQAIDRTHRIGQTAHVNAYRLLARDTVEEKIRALQKEKAALAAAVVQEESLAKVLDLESLRRILA